MTLKPTEHPIVRDAVNDEDSAPFLGVGDCIMQEYPWSYDHTSFISTLAHPCIQGVRELNSTALWASADLRAYRTSKHIFYLLNFWRAFPSEDPAATPHLKQSVRGQSIMWRGLRPELVRSNAVPLSPDANLLVTHDSPDWRRQADDVNAATCRLVHEVNNRKLRRGGGYGPLPPSIPR